MPACAAAGVLRGPLTGQVPGVLLPVALLAFCVALQVAVPARAAPVDQARAENAIRGWLSCERAPLGAALGPAIERTEGYRDEAGKLLYWVVHLAPCGFVVVPADDALEPVLAFSALPEFVASPHNPLYVLVESDVRARLAHSRRPGARIRQPDALGPAPPGSAAARWERLDSLGAAVAAGSPAPPAPAGEPAVSDERVPPLLASVWSQSVETNATQAIAVYSYYTPPYAAGDTNNFVCGCVATAMAQFMFGDRWPATGVGTASFEIKTNGVATTRSLRGGDGAGGAYSWAEMVADPDATISAEQAQAIGALCHDAGVAVSMSYSNNASSAQMSKVPLALTDTFGYANAVWSYNSMADLGAAANDMVNPNLDAGRATLLGIWGASGGHAIACDGYGYNANTLYHHLNMGWAGVCDAWYDLPDISDAGYTSVFTCVYNVFTNETGEIVSGRVIESSGLPATNATVTIDGGGTNRTTGTNARGIYAFPGLLADTEYEVSVETPGYSYPARWVATGNSRQSAALAGNCWGVDFSPNVYVSPAGSHTPPFSDWATAATNIQAAVDQAAAGEAVVLTNGTYTLAAHILVTNAITVRGLAGSDATIVDGNDTVRCFRIEHTDAIVDGLTLRRGNATDGGAVYAVNGGTIKNCTLVHNSAGTAGGAVYGPGGLLVQNCTIASNSAGYGAAVYLAAGGSVIGCTIVSNAAATHGGGVYCELGGTVQGCTLRQNRAVQNGGGAYCEQGGILSYCTIVANTAAQAGAAYCRQYGGEVAYCTIYSNAATDAAGAVMCDQDGEVHNSLIYENSSGGDAGGVFCDQGGLLQNCTIADNSAADEGGGVFCSNGGAVHNCILYFNTAVTDGSNFCDFGTGQDYWSCCSLPAPPGTAHLTNDPQFVCASAANYHLTEGSPCIDSGGYQSWMEDAGDLDGNGRIANGTVDRGAYEFTPEPLNCTLAGDPVPAVAEQAIVFTATVDGPQTGEDFYWWDFENDGNWDVARSESPTATNAYASTGTYSVALKVLTQRGQFGGTTNTGYVTAHPRPAVTYVSLTGTDTAPYTNWTMAATELQTGVDAVADGGEVVVWDGTYSTGGRAVYNGMTNRVAVTNAVTVRSRLNWPALSIIRGSGGFLGASAVRCAYLGSGARLIGLILEDGRTRTTGDLWYEKSGGGVLCEGGTLSNCLVHNCTAYMQAGGVLVYGSGLVQDSTIQLNDGWNGCGGVTFYWGGTIEDSTIESCENGGVTFSWGGTARRCRIQNNSSDDDGGGVYCSIGGTLESCLVYHNTATDRGGGVYCSYGGTVLGCTIVSNSASHAGGICGTRDFADPGYPWGVVSNSIVYYNAADSNANYYHAAESGSNAVEYAYCCTTPAPDGPGHIAAEPGFRETTGAGLRLRWSAPCIDAGSPTGYPATDLEKNDRPLDGNCDGTNRCDIGAYEHDPTAADSDADGLTDAEEFELYGTEPLVADSDGDQQNDGDETIAGTDPLSATNYFRVHDLATDGTELIMSWQGVTGRLYTVQTSTNLAAEAAWTNVPAYVDRDGVAGTMCFTNSAPLSIPEYHRVRVRTE
ncbi:MAG: C10 family peptidase [Kiritimatiellae bacterium]|nr:C10 family peptidase [Kiritimatiellia bacterium]